MSKPRGKPYSQDLRDRVLNATGAIRDLAERFGVSPSYVSKAKVRLRESGERTARPFVGRPGRKLAPHFAALRARVAEVPDATLEELRAWLRTTLGVSVSIGGLWHTLDFLGLRLKKRPSMPPSRIGRTSPRRGRRGGRSSRS
jgi:transposase